VARNPALETPWQRLPWTLPGALLIGLLCLWGGALLMSGNPVAPALPEKTILETQIIELSPPPPKEKQRPKEKKPSKPESEPQPAPAPKPQPQSIKPPATLAAPSAPSAEDWQLASSYSLKNAKRYRNTWGQQVRSQMGTAVEGPDQGQVRFRITINPDGTLAQVEELWSTSAKASELAHKAIAEMPRLPPTPDRKKLMFEKTISFLPYETGWPPSYKNDCLPEPPQFKNRFAWNGSGSPLATPPMPQREERAEDCHPSDVEATFDEEEAELKRQVERNRWGR